MNTGATTERLIVVLMIIHAFLTTSVFNWSACSDSDITIEFRIRTRHTLPHSINTSYVLLSLSGITLSPDKAQSLSIWLSGK